MFIFGFRISEQLGLKVDSIDFVDNTVEIYDAVTIKCKKGEWKKAKIKCFCLFLSGEFHKKGIKKGITN